MKRKILFIIIAVLIGVMWMLDPPNNEIKQQAREIELRLTSVENSLNNQK